MAEVADPQRTASGNVIPPEAELEKIEAETGVVPKDAPESDGKKMLAHFGRSGSTKAMIRQGSSSARRGSTPSTWMDGGKAIDPAVIEEATAAAAGEQK